MGNVWQWIKKQIVQGVPEEIALCEFDCHKQQCTTEEWEACPRRIARAAGELMPGSGSKRIVILLGPPGAGKGTQAQRIAGQYGLQHLSTGSMLRDTVHCDTELAKKLKLLINRGDLVPDDIVLRMVQDRMAQSDCENGCILDGFPRTLPQAQGLEEICRLYKSKSTTVLNIVVKPELLIRRLASRRICKMSGHIYSLVDRPPLRPGICDVDGSELVQRPDDREAVIRERIRTYERHIRPLIEYYSARGLLYEVQGAGDPDAVMANITKVLDGKKPQQNDLIGALSMGKLSLGPSGAKS